LQSELEGLAALGSPEAYDRPPEVDVAYLQQPDARVAGRRGDEDRDDGRISQIKRPIPGTASLEGPQIV